VGGRERRNHVSCFARETIIDVQIGAKPELNKH
jgi:hypothetical protein